MAEQQRQYIAIDLKSFYASVECVERGLNPLDACLVVADPTRTDKTICLAVSPALKAMGIGGRPRLFEVEQRLREVNRSRGRAGRSFYGSELARRPDLAVSYIIAPPRMALYMDFSTRIYSIYLRYIAPEDIHVYSIDEVFIDATPYLRTYRMSAHDLAMRMMREVLRDTGITATAGIGTNLYLCKIAMDIKAKKMEPDADGVRIAYLDEHSYRRELWDHEPLTDFWRVGRGIARKLEQYGIRTMGQIARYSIDHEPLFFSLFGVNAELLIDHAWGWEPVTMPMIKSYRPETHSISSGQVLTRPYKWAEARNVVMEMIDSVALELVDKGLVTNQIVLQIGYDTESLRNPAIVATYTGRVVADHYGRPVPAHAHGSSNIAHPTSSGDTLTTHVTALFDRIVDRNLLVRRITICAAHLVEEQPFERARAERPVQLDLFTDYDELRRREKAERENRERERRHQQAVLRIKKTFGKNAILNGRNFGEGATQRERNGQIGGHKA